MQGVTGATASYQYDPNGNLTQKVEDGETWVYVWNAEDELIRVCKDLVAPQECDSDGIAVASFMYDPLGRRLERLAGAITSAWTYDGEDIIDEGHNGVHSFYVHGPRVDQPLMREDVGAAAVYLHADALGSIVRTTDTAGDGVASRSYDAWGDEISPSPQPGFGYTGREWEPQTGLYYYRARYYDPKLGRFISEDPIGFEDGPNVYAYVGSNPVLRTDPTGLFRTWADWGTCFSDFKACKVKRLCAIRAERMVIRVYGGDTDGARSNAFKHCFVSCCISKKVGPCRTETNTTAHEKYPGNPPRDLYMDLRNNYRGMTGAIAFPERGCRRICLDAPATYYRPEGRKDGRPAGSY
jgi:RHS repeat-associated protein